jgi:serine/threonine protein kinase
VSQLVGAGALGRVYYATRIIDRLPVALKVMQLDAATDDVAALMVEVSNMAIADSDNVVRFHDVFWPAEPLNSMVVVVEWVAGGSLAEVLEMRLTLGEDFLLAVTVDALLGLEHLHSSCHLVHRDVKGANLLISRSGVAKLGDFGSAGAIVGSEGVRQTAIGTPGWIAPEVAAVLKDRVSW